LCGEGAGRLRGRGRVSNAGAICEHRRASRGGGQPEGRDSDPRGEAESLPLRHKNILAN
jgi:hypothetical protein